MNSIRKELIQGNYTRTLDQVDELEAIATKLKRISANELNNIIISMRRNWSGNEAEHYLPLMEDLKNQIYLDAKSVQNTAHSIKVNAKKIQNVRLKEAKQR